MIINKYKLLQNLEETYSLIGCTKTHGVGVIAIRDIPKATNPLSVLVPESVIDLTEKDLEELPIEVVYKIRCIFDI